MGRRWRWRWRPDWYVLANAVSLAIDVAVEYVSAREIGRRAKTVRARAAATIERIRSGRA